MATTDLARLVASLELETAKYQKSMDAANKKLDRFSRDQSRLLGKVGAGFRTVTAFARGFLGVLSAGAFVAIAKNTAATAEGLEHLSTRLGVAADQLQAWQLIGERFGVQQNSLNTGIQRMARRAAEAAKGTGEAKDAIRELGINAQQFNNLSLDKKMLLLADSFSAVGSEEDKIRLAFKLFDTEGVGFLQFLKQGRTGLEELRSELDGQLWSDEERNKLSQLNQRLTELSQTIKLKLGEVLASLLSTFDKISSTNVIDLLEKIEALELSIEKSGDRQQRGGHAGGAKKKQLEELRAELSRILGDTQGLERTLADLEAKLVRVTTGVSQGRNASTMQAIANEVRAQIEIVKGLIGESKAIAAAAAPSNRTATVVAESDADATSRIKILTDMANFNDELVEQTRKRVVAQRNLQQELLAPFVMTTRETADEMDALVFGTADKMKEALGSFQALFTENLVQAADGSFDQILKSWTRTITQMIAQAASAKLFGAFAGTSIAKSLTGFFGGARASGGPVSAGKGYLVGERGPELFMPKSSGSIVPNGGGGVQIVVNDQRGAGAPPIDVREQMVGAARQIRIMVRGELAGAFADGSIDKLFSASSMPVKRRGSR